MSHSDANPAEDRFTNKMILVVEEDNRLRASLSDTLRSLGYTVYSTANALEALAAAEGLMPSIGLVITDLLMPGMNAKRLYDTLKAREYGGMMLILTADPMSESATTLAEHSDVVVAQKPIGSEELRLLLAETVGRPDSRSASNKK